jgi:hypothetical protein
MIPRVQRSRRPGTHLPVGTIYVGRPSHWGNRHDWQTLGREEAVCRFAADIAKLPDSIRQAWLEPLRRATALACWCPLDEPCHADLLRQWLEEPRPLTTPPQPGTAQAPATEEIS